MSLFGDEFLDVVEFEEGFERGERVDVDVKEFVADFQEGGVVELDEAELVALGELRVLSFEF